MQVEGKEVLIASAVALAVASVMWRIGKFLFISLTGLVKDYFESIKQSIEISLKKSNENEKCIGFIKKDIDNLADKIRRDIIELESDFLKLNDEFYKCKDHHDK